MSAGGEHLKDEVRIDYIRIYTNFPEETINND